MEPPTPSNWSPSATKSRLLVVLLFVATVSFTTPVLAQDATEADGSFELQGEQLVLERGGSQVIAGTVSLDEGETVTVRIRSTSGENPFLKTDEATVDADGEFNATFDTRDISDENSTVEFTASLHTEEGAKLASVEGVIVGKNADFTTQTTTTTTTTTETTTAATTTEPSSIDAPGFGIVGGLLGISLAAISLVTRRIRS